MGLDQIGRATGLAEELPLRGSRFRRWNKIEIKGLFLIMVIK